MHSHGSIHQKMGKEEISSKSQCRENLTKELSSSVMVQTQRRLMNEQIKGIFIIVFTLVTVNKTLDSNLKAFCVSNVYFFASSYQKNFKFQLWFLVQNSINLHVPKDASLLGTEYTPHGRWQFFQQLGSHDAQKHSFNDLKSSEVKFSKLLLGEILLKVHKNATDVNQCGKSRIQLPHKFSQLSQKTTSIRIIFYFNYYSLIKDLHRQFCQFLRETFQDLQIAFFSFKHCLPT